MNFHYPVNPIFIGRVSEFKWTSFMSGIQQGCVA